MNNRVLLRLALLVTTAAACCNVASAQMPTNMTLWGTETQVWGNCHFNQRTGNYTCYPVWNYGTVSVTANGKSVTASYSQSSTNASVAQALCALMTSAFPIQCTSVSGAALVVKASSSAGAISVSSTTGVKVPYDDGYPTPTPSFSIGLPIVTGSVNPKYKVIGIAYTVPGQQSFVQYTNTTMMGSGTSTNSSFSTNVTVSVAICGGTGTGGVCGSNNGVSITGTYTNSFTQESDSSSSFATNQTTSFVDKLVPLTGPALDHGNDVIYLWVNPVVWYSYTLSKVPPSGPVPLQWNGYTYDLADDSNNMEIIPVRLSELLNPSTIDTYTQGRLQRLWAQPNTDGSTSGITDQDLLNIAATDPFSNPNYIVTIGSDGKTSTDARFTQSANTPLWYLVGQTNSYNWSYTATGTQGQGGKTTYADSFALEEKYQADWFVADLTYDWKQSTTFTWVDQWTNTKSKMTGQMASVSITGPTGSYTGPDEFNVFQDNVYGTFMVYPVPPH